jgi:xanthine dehydrogenase YagR molybdenum-binding subunit
MVHLFLAPMAARSAGCAVKVVLDTRDTFSLLSYRGEVRQRHPPRRDDGGAADGARGRGRRRGRGRGPVCRARRQLVLPGLRPARASAPPSRRAARPERHGLDARAGRRRRRCSRWRARWTSWRTGSGLDPLELRIRNHADRDPESGKPWTSKHLLDCYEAGARAIGWHTRPGGGTRAPGDGRLIGYGMATSYESCFRFPASVATRLGRDGRATVEATVAEMGQGAWTGLHLLAVEALRLAPGDVVLETARTELPAGAGAIASTGVHSNGQSLLAAAAAVRAELLGIAVRDPASPLHGLAAEALTIAEGIVRGPGNRAESVRKIMARHPRGTSARPRPRGATSGGRRRRRRLSGRSSRRCRSIPRRCTSAWSASSAPSTAAGSSRRASRAASSSAA